METDYWHDVNLIELVMLFYSYISYYFYQKYYFLD